MNNLIDKYLPESNMKTTAMDAVKILAQTDDENKAWKKAQEDEGLLPNTTKQKWLKWAYNSQQYHKIKSGMAKKKGY